MKRGKAVLSRQRTRRGQDLLRWAAEGMNLAEGFRRSRVQACARQCLGRGRLFADRLDRVIDTIPESVTQFDVEALLLSAQGSEEAEKQALTYEERALSTWERDDHFHALARACRALGY